MSGRPVRAVERDLLRLAGAGAEKRRLDLAREAARAELEDGVALRLARGVDEVDDERVALLRGPAVGGRELGHGLAQRLDLGVDRLLRNLDLGARDLERRPVGDLGERLHVDGGGEAPALVGCGRELVLVLRLGDGADTRLRDAALQNQPPMWLSTASA